MPDAMETVGTRALSTEALAFEAMAIEIEDLYYRYRDGTEALRGITLSVKRGERLALLGPNGAGKSTLLLHLNGIFTPHRGTVRVLGREVNREAWPWVRGIVGLVFQDPDDQVFSSTVGEDVAFGPLNQGLAPAEVEERVKEALAAVGLEGFHDRVPHHLSYGEKKRVAIAGVLAMGPEILVLDEPTAFLDPEGQRQVMAILEKLHAAGKTLLVATHDVDLAAGWADRVAILRGGRVLAQGGPELLVSEEVVTAAGLCFPTTARVFERAGLAARPLTVEEAAAVLREMSNRLSLVPRNKDS